MNTFLRKYWPLIAIGLIVLSFAILVQVFKATNVVAGWIFNFLDDWSTSLSAAGTFLVASVAIYSILKARRERSSDNIRIWARDALRMLVFTDTTQSPPENLEQEVNRLKTGIKSIFSETNSIINDANKCGEVCLQKVLKTIHNLTQYITTLEHTQDAEYADKILALHRELVEGLADVIDTVSK